MPLRQRPQPDQCPFCVIAEGNAPAHVVYEDPGALAILDVAPVRRGHTVVIPRRHVEDLTTVGATDALTAMASALTETASQLIGRLGADGLTMIQANGAAAGQDITHLHVHLIPRRQGEDRLTVWERSTAERDRLAETAELLCRPAR